MKNKVFTKSRLSNKRPHFTDSVKNKTRLGVFRCSFIGLAVSVGVSILLCLISASILLATDDPARIVTPTAFSILYVSAFVGGAIASSLKRGSAFLCGTAVGTAILLITYLLSFAASHIAKNDFSFTEATALRIAIPVCSLMGALAGIAKKAPTPSGRKNLKKR